LGGKGKEGLVWTTLGVRSFLGITEPAFRAFKTAKLNEDSGEDYYFGLWDAADDSLVVAKDEWLFTYGNTKAQARLLQRLHDWIALIGL
jgi:hypothetical protein